MENISTIDNFVIDCIQTLEINYVEIEEILDNLLSNINQSKRKIKDCLILIIKKYRLRIKFRQKLYPINDIKKSIEKYLNQRQKALLYLVDYNPLYRRDYDEYIKYIEELSKPLQKLYDQEKENALKEVYDDVGLVYMQDLIEKVYPKLPFFKYWIFDRSIIWSYIVKNEYNQGMSLKSLTKYISLIPHDKIRWRVFYELLVYEYKRKGKKIEELIPMITKDIIPNDEDRDEFIQSVKMKEFERRSIDEIVMNIYLKNEDNIF
jgi:hypothetical protein